MKLHQDMAKFKWGRPPLLAIHKVFVVLVVVLVLVIENYNW
jgi:hypothetical protein